LLDCFPRRETSGCDGRGVIHIYEIQGSRSARGEVRSGFGEFHERIASTGVRAGERAEARFKNPESRGRNLNREVTGMDF